MQTHSTDTRLIRTPGYCGQFRLSRRKAYIFSKINRLIQTPVNTDNGHFSVSRVTNSRTLSTLQLFRYCLSYHKLFSNFQTFKFCVIFIADHLAESQTKRLSRRKSQGLFQMFRFRDSEKKSKKSNETVINERKVSLV